MTLSHHFWVPLGPLLATFWAPLGTFGIPGALLGATWAPKGRQKSEKRMKNRGLKSTLAPSVPKTVPKGAQTSKMEPQGYQNEPKIIKKPGCPVWPDLPETKYLIQTLDKIRDKQDVQDPFLQAC